MATVSQILEDQVIHVKRGRLNGLGFEPAFNSYFDFYLSPKYIDPPLLQLEDVTFHLFLRKNLNDRDPSWRMPSIRQMMRRLAISQVKIDNMMKRLDQAKLLEKVSGYRGGEDGGNIPNHYILSDPLQTLEEFLAVAAAGVFGRDLKEEWRSDPCIENQYTPYLLSMHPPVSEINTYKQTSSLLKQEDLWWSEILSMMKQQLTDATYYSTLEGSQLQSLTEGRATVLLNRPAAREWCERQLGKRISDLLTIESKQKITCVVWDTKEE
jgi:hypothetical protein